MTQPEAMKTESYVYGVEKLNGYDAWALFEACAMGDVSAIEALLAKDPRLVNAQYWYQLPIHNAVRAGHTEIVELLLDRGADPGQSRFTYNSWDKLLLIAGERGYLDIEAALRREMGRRFGYSPEFDSLKAAIIARDSRKVEDILRDQPHLALAADALGNNALHWSVITRQLGLIGRFVDRGTPIDAQRADGQTPVLLAVNGAADYWYRATRGRSHPSLRDTSVIAGYLLARGAGYTLSVAAAIGDQERVEKILLEDPGQAKRLDSARFNPLSYAAREGHVHIVRLLLGRGADPNLPEEGASKGAALFSACSGNHREVAELLLDHGADPNAGTDSSGCCLTVAEVYHGRRAKPLQDLLRRYGAYTPPYAMNPRELKRAIREGHEVTRHEEFLCTVMRERSAELLDLYLEADPTVPQRMSSEEYPRSPALVRKLLTGGLDPSRPDWQGKTLLHACAERGDRSVAAVLLEAGADIDARDLEHQGTPLASAVRMPGQEEETVLQRRRMVELLLKRGAAKNLPDDPPWATPLAWANRLGHGDLVTLLKHYGATT